MCANNHLSFENGRGSLAPAYMKLLISRSLETRAPAHSRPEADGNGDAAEQYLGFSWQRPGGGQAGVFLSLAVSVLHHA